MPRPPRMLQAAVEAQRHRGAARTPTPRDQRRHRVEASMLKDGRTIAAEAVVVAVGIRPNADLARDAGARGQARHRGRRRAARPSIAGIYAIGECAEHRGVCYGLVEPAYEQARVLADAAGRRQRALCRQRARDQSQGLRRQRVLGRRLLGRSRHRGDRALRSGPRHLQEARHRGRPTGRRGAVRRYRRRALVSRPDPLRRADIERFRDDLAFGRALAERTVSPTRWRRDMSGDFTPDQKRYLEGFVSGPKAARAARGAGPAGEGRAGRARRDPSQGAGPRPSRRAASSSIRRNSSASSIRSTPMTA